MSVPTADIAELLSLLSAADSVEALDAAWPRITPLLRELGTFAATRQRSLDHRPRPVRDERDGSWCLPEPGRRAPHDRAWQELAEAIEPAINGPVFTDPMATDKRDRLLTFYRKIQSHRVKRT